MNAFHGPWKNLLCFKSKKALEKLWKEQEKKGMYLKEMILGLPKMLSPLQALTWLRNAFGAGRPLGCALWFYF